MEIKKLNAFIAKYLKGRASKSESLLLESWIDKIVDGSAMEIAEHESDVSKRIALKVKKEVERKAYLITPVIWLKIAAVVLPLLFSSILLYKVLRQPEVFVFTTANGEHKEVTLPDSSEVFLKPNSRLTYREDFTSKRNVELKGEAFFDVKRDKKRAFRVFSENIRVEVLGTSFNVQSYGDLQNVTVAVRTGKVKVSNNNQSVAYLYPEDKLYLDKKTGRSMIKKNLNTGRFQEKYLEFEGESLSDVLKILEKYYPVNFSARVFPNVDITGSLNPAMTIDQIVEVLNALIEKHHIEIKRLSNNKFQLMPNQ